ARTLDNPHSSANPVAPPTHSNEPEPLFSRPAEHAPHLDPHPIISDGTADHPRVSLELHRHAFCLSVPGDVVQGFLHEAIDRRLDRRCMAPLLTALHGDGQPCPN